MAPRRPPRRRAPRAGGAARVPACRACTPPTPACRPPCLAPRPPTWPAAEILGWVGFTVATQTAAAALFTLVGAAQMAQWALGKHTRLRKVGRCGCGRARVAGALPAPAPRPCRVGHTGHRPAAACAAPALLRCAACRRLTAGRGGRSTPGAGSCCRPSSEAAVWGSAGGTAAAVAQPHSRPELCGCYTMKGALPSRQAREGQAQGCHCWQQAT